MLPHLLPKPQAVENHSFGPSLDKEAALRSSTCGRYIQVREKMPGPLSAETAADAATEEMIAEEWSSLVDAHLLESPRSAHDRIREIRQAARMHQAWQKEVFREMQAKLQRYERDEPSPRLLKSRMEEAPPQPAQPPPFSQKQQREILEEFQRQQEEKLRQQREVEERQARQRRSSRRKEATKMPMPEKKPAQHAQPSAPKKSALGQLFSHMRWKISSLLGRGRDAVTAYEGENAASVESQTELLLQQMKETLSATRHEPLAFRRKVFRELQRKLHPDKNADCRDAAKLAFQQLMDQQSRYLKEAR